MYVSPEDAMLDFLPEYIRDYVLWRDRYRCVDCAHGARLTMRERLGRLRGSALEVHHVLARQDGGTNYPWNLETVCRPHCQKRVKRQTAMRALRRLATERGGEAFGTLVRLAASSQVRVPKGL